MKRYVAGFMFDMDDPESVLLIQKNRPDWQAGKWNAIGGKIEPTDDSPAHAMVREFREETGLSTSFADPGVERPGMEVPGFWRPFVILTNEKVGYRVHFYRALGPIKSARGLTDETVHLHSWPFHHDLAVIDNLWWLVPMAMDYTIQAPVHIEDIGDT